VVADEVPKMMQAWSDYLDALRLNEKIKIKPIGKAT
jgi:hypothetical protein